MRNRCLALSLLVLFPVLGCGGGGAPGTASASSRTYSIADLGVFEGVYPVTYWSSYGLSENGIASIQQGLNPPKPVIWQNGQRVELPLPAGHLGAQTRGANSTGTVLGTLDPSVTGGFSSPPPQPLMWQNGVATILPLPTGAAGPQATALNEKGDAVGFAMVGNHAHGFVWKSGGVTDIGLFEGRSVWPYDVNDHGVIVGRAQAVVGVRAFLWKDGAYRTLAATGYGDSIAWSVNDSEQAAGSASKRVGERQAVIWEGGRLRELGTLGGNDSEAFGINNLGDVVGEASTGIEDAKGRVYHAFAASNGSMVDLNSRLRNANGWVILSAFSINDAQQILGLGRRNGTDHYVLLTPD